MTNPYFWPGTTVVKSLDNDFNWRAMGDEEFVASMREFLRQSRAGTMGGQTTRKIAAAKEAITTYSRAKPKGEV